MKKYRVKLILASIICIFAMQPIYAFDINGGWLDEVVIYPDDDYDWGLDDDWWRDAYVYDNYDNDYDHYDDYYDDYYNNHSYNDNYRYDSAPSNPLQALSPSQIKALYNQWKNFDWSNPNMKYMVDIDGDGIIDGYVFMDKNGNLHYQSFDLKEVVIEGDKPDNTKITPVPVPTPLDPLETAGISDAKKIFRNSKMTDVNWKKIDDLLKKILKDCLGEALYNALINNLNGKSLVIQFGNESSFDYTNGTITLDMMAAESNRLFHEMWHAYQAYNETQTSFSSSLMNQEFEAWYAQYLYISKLPEYKEGSTWYRWYNDSKIGIAVQNLKRFVNTKGYLLQGELNLYSYLNNVMMPIFNRSGYSQSSYPFDYNRSGAENFNNFKKLSINCP